MPLQRAVVVGTDNVLDTYDLFADGECTYSVWYAERKKYFQPPHKHDFQASRDMLEKFLQGFEAADDSTLYYLRIHRPDFKGEVITPNTPFIADFPFRPVDLPADAKNLGIMNGMPIGFRSALQELNGLPQMLKDQQQEILELKQELEERDEQPGGFMGMLNGMLQSEQMQQAILAGIGKFMGNFNPGNAPAITLNGMNDTNQQVQPKPMQVDLQDLDETLSRLSAHINLNADLKKLADYLDKNPGSVPVIMGFLR